MEPTNDYAQVPASTLSGEFLQKTLQIQIAAQDLEMLKQGGYQLCVAKNMAGSDASYDVVWYATSDYLQTNTFSWQQLYQLFAANMFESNVIVQASTNMTDIGLGEQAVLDQSGLLGEPSTGGPANGITFINQYGSIHPGLCQLYTGLDGQEISCPTFVSVNPIVTGSTTLSPVEKVLVWFQQNVQTSMMFDSQPSMSIEADLTMTDSVTLSFANQQWSTG